MTPTALAAADLLKRDSFVHAVAPDAVELRTYEANADSGQSIKSMVADLFKDQRDRAEFHFSIVQEETRFCINVWEQPEGVETVPADTSPSNEAGGEVSDETNDGSGEITILEVEITL